VIAEVERIWGLGWGGWWEMPRDEAMQMLSWWWVHTQQDERAEAAGKANAPKPPKVRTRTGRAARRG